MQMGDAVFGQDGKPISVDQFGNAVMDLFVHMIRTAGKYNAVGVMLFHPF